MRNAQGNYNQGRGADGLNGYETSRFGTAVPMSNRPGYLSMRRELPATLMLNGESHYADRTLGFPPRMSKPVTVRPGKTVAKVTPATIVRTVERRRPRRLSRGAKIRQRRQFINWLRDFAPQLYAHAKRRADMIEQTEGGLGALANWFDSFMDTISDVGGKYLQVRTQKEILDAQMERMRQGLPPLQTSEYAPTVAVKPDAGTTREITGAIGAGFGSMIPWIAGGAALLLLVGRRRR